MHAMGGEKRRSEGPLSARLCCHVGRVFGIARRKMGSRLQSCPASKRSEDSRRLPRIAHRSGAYFGVQLMFKQHDHRLFSSPRPAHKMRSHAATLVTGSCSPMHEGERATEPSHQSIPPRSHRCREACGCRRGGRLPRRDEPPLLRGTGGGLLAPSAGALARYGIVSVSGGALGGVKERKKGIHK